MPAREVDGRGVRCGVVAEAWTRSQPLFHWCTLFVNGEMMGVQKIITVEV